MRRLFILRPEPGASSTVRAARELGLDAVAMPLFEVEPLAWEAPDPGRFDGLLLTSANALRHGGAGLDGLRALPVHAVGETTAAAAREAGFAVASRGESGVERLLRSIDPELRLLHLCGQHRTSIKASQKIATIPVYRSAEVTLASQLGQIEGQTVALHSARAGRRLGDLADEHRIDRSTVRVAAISEAAASAAGGGWDSREAVERPDSAALLALAARLCDKPGRP